MNHEITNMDVFDALRHRAERESRQLRVACRRNDELNRKFDDLAQLGFVEGEIITVHFPSGDQLYKVGTADWNSQRGFRNLVHPQVQRKDDGKRTTPGRVKNDVRDVDNESIGKTLAAIREPCTNNKCPDWQNPISCMDRQRSGTCSEIKGRGDRPHTRRHDRPGRKQRDNRRESKSKG